MKLAHHRRENNSMDKKKNATSRGILSATLVAIYTAWTAQAAAGYTFNQLVPDVRQPVAARAARSHRHLRRPRSRGRPNQRRRHRRHHHWLELDHLPINRSYTVYAEPLDGAVSPAQITPAIATLSRNPTTDPGWPPLQACVVPAAITSFTTRSR
jgi:hypothetical protein